MAITVLIFPLLYMVSTSQLCWPSCAKVASLRRAAVVNTRSLMIVRIGQLILKAHRP